MESIRHIVGLTVFCLLLAGCSDAPRLVIHEPGYYQGKVDPLLRISATEQHKQQLIDRLMIGQTDR